MENVDYEDPELDQTLAKVGNKMEKAVDWARSIVFESVERGRGRVSPCKLMCLCARMNLTEITL